MISLIKRQKNMMFTSVTKVVRNVMRRLSCQSPIPLSDLLSVAANRADKPDLKIIEHNNN